ncbi:212_t:CDS:2, partial [Paraglomus occultum]
EFDIREKKLKTRIREISKSAGNTLKAYNRTVKLIDENERLKREIDTLKYNLRDRDKKLAQKKTRITDLHCQNFALALLRYRDRAELINTQETLQNAQIWDTSNEYESDENSQDSYTSDPDMTTIIELADTIDGYLDITGTNRTILSNQIKRVTRQIRRKYNNLQTDLINEQQRRYNAEAERDIRQTELTQTQENLNLITTAYNNERVAPTKQACSNTKGTSHYFRSFQKYQAKILKSHRNRITTPAYWGILDLTKESLYGCEEFTEKEICELSQDFANSIAWNPKLAPYNLQEYFNGNCEITHNDNINNDQLKKLHHNIQFIKENMYSFCGAMTEEELKMISTFPLFRSIISSDTIKDSWGEIQSIATSDTRNSNADSFQQAQLGRKVDMKVTLLKTPIKFEALFGKVAGGLGPFGIPLACRKKRYLDKVKLAIIMRDSLNHILKDCLHISDDRRKALVVYGWLQIGLEVNFYAMDWQGSGLYRFGLLDRYILPSEEENCGLFEEAYCVLNEVKEKLLQTEVLVKELYFENMLSKCHQIGTKNDPALNAVGAKLPKEEFAELREDFQTLTKPEQDIFLMAQLRAMYGGTTSTS